MEFTLTVSRDSFVDPKTGAVVEYNVYTAVIGGQTFYFSPRPTDKKLLNFILDGLAKKQG